MKEKKRKESYEKRMRFLIGTQIAIFLVLILRLWFLQIVMGDYYRAQAEENRLKIEKIEALRGKIMDVKGRQLATNKLSYALFIDKEHLDNEEIYKRLEPILGIEAGKLKEKAKKSRSIRENKVLLAKDLSLEQVAMIQEEKERYPHVTVSYMPVRHYPFGTTAAHVIGYVGEISEEDILENKYPGADRGDIVGKTGVERAYDAFLRGTKGKLILEVDALGNVKRNLGREDPVPGNDIYLTIDLKIQKAAEKALEEAIKMAHRKKHPRAAAGAIVVLNVNTGEVLALASYPSFNPDLFVGGIDPRVWKELNLKKNNYPLLNRATNASYPPASTFKPLTLISAMERGLTYRGERFICTGRWTGFGESWAKYCWKRSGHGSVNFTRAVYDSCDVVFYDLGLRIYRTKDEALQETARKYGFGSKTGIAIGDISGRVPDREWKKKNFKKRELQVWLPGDTVNMAIGQGDLLVTPIQMARFYAALANGGKLYKPIIVKKVVSPTGKVVKTFQPELENEVKISPGLRRLILQGLRQVVTRGTAKSAFYGFPVEISGKTGTAQVYGKDDYAWFVGFGPSKNPEYVVSVIIEQGGHGGEVAAPAARYVFSHLFGVEEEELVSGSDVSR